MNWQKRDKEETKGKKKSLIENDKEKINREK